MASQSKSADCSRHPKVRASQFSRLWVNMALPQNHPSYLVLDNPNFQRWRLAHDASINRELFVAGNQYLLAQPQPLPQPMPQPQPPQQQQQQQQPHRLNLAQLPVVVLEQILVPLFNTRPVQIVNPWSFQWAPGANHSNIYDPTVPIPKAFPSFANSGVRLFVPTDIRMIAISRPIFNAMIYTYGRHKPVLISNCYLSQLVSSLNHLQFFQQILRRLLRRTRAMVIKTGRYHRLERRITDFARYCDSVRVIQVLCERGCRWVETPLTQQHRVEQHLSYSWLPNGWLVRCTDNQIARFIQRNAWPAGLERAFRRYMYATAEWRNAQRLVQAIARKRQRTRDLQPIQMRFDIRFMVMQQNHVNALIQHSDRGGFQVLVSLHSREASLFLLFASC